MNPITQEPKDQQHIVEDPFLPPKGFKGEKEHFSEPGGQPLFTELSSVPIGPVLLPGDSCEKPASEVVKNQGCAPTLLSQEELRNLHRVMNQSTTDNTPPWEE